MKSRIDRIFSNSSMDVDAFIVINSENPNLDPNFFYTSGIKTGVFERCVVVGFKKGKSYLLTSELEEPIAEKETKLEIVTFKTKKEFEDALGNVLSDVNKLGANFRNISFKHHSDISKLTKAELVDMSDAFSKSRSIKDKEEIESISKACEISSKAAGEFPEYVKMGVTEKELSRKLVELQFSNGATNLAFSPSIVAFGGNASEPHHFPSDRKLHRNEFVLVDFGAEYQRYASDISRTFVFGKADQKMKEIYETVLDAQMQAIDMVRDGVNGKDVDKLARGIVDKKFKGRFIHSLGHEVGLQVHDGDVLSSQRDFILKEDMVVTIEPGIYISSIGGVRIEDTVLVKKSKAKILTTSTKELVEL